ncbi:hypothetical protein [Paraburkholderia sp. SIMBA_054]|uniref:hypothetical protein n=1 Tax=Paraburkholderia sp. SIMBA_054 TaxID=3085795 RepID=UPI00397A386C
MKNAIHGNTQSGNTPRRAGMALAVSGSALAGASLAFDGVGGCARLAQVYLGNHNLALAMLLVGATATGYGVYLQIKHRVRASSRVAVGDFARS